MQKARREHRKERMQKTVNRGADEIQHTKDRRRNTKKSGPKERRTSRNTYLLRETSKRKGARSKEGVWNK